MELFSVFFSSKLDNVFIFYQLTMLFSDIASVHIQTSLLSIYMCLHLCFLYIYIQKKVYKSLPFFYIPF